jgi:hypothetical protein
VERTAEIEVMALEELNALIAWVERGGWRAAEAEIRARPAPAQEP